MQSTPSPDQGAGEARGTFRSFWAAALIALAVVLFPLAVSAQEDPCIEALSGSPEALQSYEDGVGAYVSARSEGDVVGQLRALDELWGLCDENLRIRVFMGQAHLADGDCPAAVDELAYVFNRLPTWSSRAHAADAEAKARAVLSEADGCVATLTLMCTPDVALVRIDSRDSAPCRATHILTAGAHQIEVSSPGFVPYTDEVAVQTGVNTVEVPPLEQAGDVGLVEFVCDRDDVEITVSGEVFPCNSVQALDPGARPYTATWPGGAPQSGLVRVEIGKSVQEEIRADAGPGKGLLEVTCSNDDVQLEIRSVSEPEKVVNTPCPATRALGAGEYELTASADGHRTTTLPATLQAGQTLKMPIALAPNPRRIVDLRAEGGYLVYGADMDGAEPDPPGRPIVALVANLPIEGLNGITFGAGVRAALGDDIGILGEGHFGYLVSFGSFSLSYELTLGYGTQAIPACNEPPCSKEEEASLVYGIGLRGIVDMSDRMAVVVGGGYSFGRVGLIDLMGGLMIRL